MSTHSCNELCKKDERFHDLQKYESELEFATINDMREFLIKKLSEITELLKALEVD